MPFGQPDPLEQSDDRLRAGVEAVSDERVRDDLADAQPRVHGRSAVLEDHLDVALHRSNRLNRLSTRSGSRASRRNTALQQELRDIGGRSGQGGLAVAEAANAVTRLKAIPSSTELDPRVLHGFDLGVPSPRNRGEGNGSGEDPGGAAVRDSSAYGARNVQMVAAGTGEALPGPEDLRIDVLGSDAPYNR